MKEEKELSISDYLPRVFPILDLLCITWIALNSPKPYITTPLNISIPLIGITLLTVFKAKTRLSFFALGVLTSIPIFLINLYASSGCPTWLTSFAFIAGGLMLSQNTLDKFVVILFSFATTLIPFLMTGIDKKTIISVLIAELSVWFLVERCFTFMQKQQEQIKKQKQLVEEKQKEVMDSIHYAKRIQASQLPAEKIISRDLERLSKKL